MLKVIILDVFLFIAVTLMWLFIFDESLLLSLAAAFATWLIMNIVIDKLFYGETFHLYRRK